MITIIDYKAGNLASLQNALASLGATFEVTNDPKKVAAAEKIIFPGQGAAGSGMRELERAGLGDILKNTKVPFLGICLGMQLLFEASEEGDTKSLGLLPGTVKKLQTTLKIPQMGWNLVQFLRPSLLTKNIPTESYFYFANSFVAPVGDFTQGISYYGGPFTAIVEKDNFFGTQFHPEKSGESGLQLLANFLAL